jgi:hypothetical protein
MSVPISVSAFTAQEKSDTFEVALWGKNLLDKEIAENPGGLVADAIGAYRTCIEDPLT